MARNNILINSKPKKLHRSETYSSLLFRYLFLSNNENNDFATQVLAKKNIIDVDKQWAKKIVDGKHNHKYLNYDPTDFDSVIAARVENFCEAEITSDNKETTLILSHVKNILEQIPKGQPTYSIFQNLTTKLTQEKNQILEGCQDKGLNRDLVQREI